MYIQFLSSFLLFALPFILLPFGTSFFETPKVLLAEIIIEISLILLFFQTNTWSLLKKNKLLLGVICLIFLISVLHLLFFNSKTAFFGNAFRLQGVFLLWNLLAFCLISSTEKERIFSAPFYFVVSMTLLAATLIMGSNESWRAIATLGEPNALSATALFFWPFLFARIKKMQYKLFLFVIPGSIVFLSGSRSGLIAFVLQLVFLLFYRVFKRSFSFSSAISIFLLCFSLILPFYQKDLLYENRAEIWKTAWISGWERPFIGGGFGNTEKMLYDTSFRVNNTVKYQYVDSAHNIVLDWWVQGGLVGVLLFISLITIALRRMVLAKQESLFVLFVGVFSTLLFNPLSVVNIIHFWWILGRANFRE